MKAWNTKPQRLVIERTLAALDGNGIEAELAATGAEVFTMTSETLDAIGLTEELNESGRYTSVRKALFAMDPKTQGREQRKLGAAPDFAVGSVHAVTETGTLVIASRTGSQLPAYVFAGGTVIWVVGVQKIVKDVEEGMTRIGEYLLDKESARAIKAHGLSRDFRTFAGKVLLYNKEVQPGRAKLILVDEVIGS